MWAGIGADHGEQVSKKKEKEKEINAKRDEQEEVEKKIDQILA